MHISWKTIAWSAFSVVLGGVTALVGNALQKAQVEELVDEKLAEKLSDEAKGS